MKRDASEVIADMRARAKFLHSRGDDFLSVEAEKMDEWANLLAAAEPANTGRAVAYRWLRNGEPQGSWILGQPTERQFEAVNGCRNIANWTAEYAYAYTRPPSEAAAQPIMCGCHSEPQRRLCVMRDKCCRPEASSQPARSQG